MTLSRRQLLRQQALTVPTFFLLDSFAFADTISESESWTWFPPGPMQFKLTGEQTGGATSWVVGAIPARQGTPLHTHANEDEVFFILSGQFQLDVGSSSVTGGPGLTVFGPRGTLHRFTNVGSEPGRILTTFTPAGLEKYFRAFGVPVRKPTDVPSSAVLSTLMPRIVQGGAKYGITVVGPPIFPNR